MKLTKYIILLISIFLVKTLAAQDMLNSYLETAVKNNPGLQSKFNEYLASLEVAPQVKALPDPQIAFGYFIKPVETRLGPQQFKISASQMFPWMGTLKAKENAAIQKAKAKYETFEDSKSKLFYNVKSTYYNLYFVRKAIDIILENIEILKTFKILSLIKVEAGIVSSVDGLRIEIELADLENNLALLKDKEWTMQVMFNNLLNVGINESIETPETLLKADIELEKQSIIDSILIKNHQLTKLDFQLESLKYKEEVAGKLGMPNFMIGMDYIAIGTGSNNMAGTDAFVFPKIGISLPLYRNKYKAMVDEVIYLEKAKEAEKINKSNILESIFENSWQDYSDAGRRQELYQNQTLLARRVMKLLETEYATDGKNFEELLRIERHVLKYNLEFEKAQADQHAALAFINYLLGN